MIFGINLKVDHGAGESTEVYFSDIEKEELDVLIEICAKQTCPYELTLCEYLQEE